MINRWSYTRPWQFAPPLIRRYPKKRGHKSPAYLENWGECFGELLSGLVQRPAWIHAVSVGETRATQPLVEALRRHFLDVPLLLMQIMPTGRAAAQELFPDAQYRYLSYGRPEWVRQFLREHDPLFGALTEMETWSNLTHGYAEESVPLFLANARPSGKSQRGYLKMRGLVEPAMQTLNGCFTQTAADAERLHLIGVSNVHVCGNIKYDTSPSDKMYVLAAGFVERIGRRSMAVYASTRFYWSEDETELLLSAWRQYRGDTLLVVVPRHPERLQMAYDTVWSLGSRVQKRSGNVTASPQTQVWTGNSMGELFAYYSTGSAAFVGNSLVDTGCQNIVEPVACGVPTAFGFSTYNFPSTCGNALKVGVAVQVGSADEWRQTVEAWLSDDSLRARLAIQAQAFVAQHRGTSNRMAQEAAKAVQAV